MKMGKRPRSEESLESKPPEKKDKVSEFNGTVFKAMLKEPTTAMKGECISYRNVTSTRHLERDIKFY